MFFDKRFKSLEDKIDKYHETVLGNHNDLKWIKGGGALFITICLPLMITNTCSKEKDNARSSTVQEWIDANTFNQRIKGPEYR